jgi:hypothetical protein
VPEPSVYLDMELTFLDEDIEVLRAVGKSRRLPSTDG